MTVTAASRRPAVAALPGDAVVALRLTVRGHVQGTGFRPFVFRLAQQCGVHGRVRNVSAGVAIDVEGSEDAVRRFQDLLGSTAPPAAQVDGVGVEAVAPQHHHTFTIDASDLAGQPQMRVPRDLALCAACRAEIVDPSDRRHRYPFTNCTACGPRYSIVDAMPYDRRATAMHGFRMCGRCVDEYRRVEDRRFHAQPIACADCGPQVALWDRAGRPSAVRDAAGRDAVELLRGGHIVALKGLGGFQLLARADRRATIDRLRQRKQRPCKPLAVMVSGIDAVRRLADIGAAEAVLLSASANPIVLVARGALRGPGRALADGVAPRAPALGVLLPTTPLHHLLLAEVGAPLVATSGNRSEEPIVIDEREVVQCLGGIADAFLVHDRPIRRRVDDSVVGVIAAQPVPFRLARGYAPLPLPPLERLATDRCPPLIAVGGDLKTAVAVWSGSQALLGQHIGDLEGPSGRAALAATVDDLTRLYACTPAAIACDQHPDYVSAAWAERQGGRVVRVQHHHAHAAAAMVEHDLLDRETLALTWDGTGYGPDGTIWGGECLRTRLTGYERVASFLPFPLPGGAAAIRRPNRIAFALLHTLLGEEAALRADATLNRLGLSQREARWLSAMIRARIHTPWTSSVGRLFDAVAALVLRIREVSYEGEAAVALETCADARVDAPYPVTLTEIGGLRCVDWRPMLTALLDDVARDADAGVLAARFHRTLAAGAAAVAALRPDLPLVLTGGCFRNRVLTEGVLAALHSTRRHVYHHTLIPPGDGGLAVGQLAVAAATLR